MNNTFIVLVAKPHLVNDGLNDRRTKNSCFSSRILGIGQKMPI